jgi:hypothetical protein
MARPPIQPIQSKTLTGRLILRDEVVGCLLGAKLHRAE